mgnify:CR=1 FL=1
MGRRHFDRAACPHRQSADEKAPDARHAVAHADAGPLEGKVAGALVVAGQSVTLAHARAITESQGSDDDRGHDRAADREAATEELHGRPQPGNRGAYVKVVVGKSGRIQQATLLHAAIDATSSALIPPSLVKASNLHVTGHELSGQFAGEKKAPQASPELPPGLHGRDPAVDPTAQAADAPAARARGSRPRRPRRRRATAACSPGRRQEVRGGPGAPSDHARRRPGGEAFLIECLHAHARAVEEECARAARRRPGPAGRPAAA